MWSAAEAGWSRVDLYFIGSENAQVNHYTNVVLGSHDNQWKTTRNRGVPRMLFDINYLSMESCRHTTEYHGVTMGHPRGIIVPQG